MIGVKLITIFVLCVSHSFADNNGIVFPGPNESSTSQTGEPTNGTTTQTPVTTTATKPTAPTTPNTTTTPTTTPKPTTPTPKPTTTTAKPTTTTTKPTTTTTIPTTTPTKPTTTPIPTSTFKPTPTPAPQRGGWTANYTGTQNSCIVFDAAIQFAFPYKFNNATGSVLVNVPATADASGVCHANATETILLVWGADRNSVQFNFDKHEKQYNLSAIRASINVTLPGQNATVMKLAHTGGVFDTPLSKSYKCAKEQVLILTDSMNSTGLLKISHLQLQAYRSAKGKSFDDALDCARSDTPDVVPIAVGCALAALVLIVLVAYLVGRRRSQARGYLSMAAGDKPQGDCIPLHNLSCFN